MSPHEQALEQLYRERSDGLRKALATVTGSYETATDALQEAFARAFAGVEHFRGDCPLGAWVWRIAVNVALEQRRSRLAWEQRTLPELDEEREPFLVGDDHDPALAAALRLLPPRRRLVVFLRYFADCSYAEIAAICSISEGTVAAAIAQAKDALREHLLAGLSTTNQGGMS